MDFVSRFSVSGYIPDLGVLKNGGIEIHRLLSVTIEPQAWGDFLHRRYSLRSLSVAVSGRRVTPPA
jgi:hypothetical protein